MPTKPLLKDEELKNKLFGFQSDNAPIKCDARMLEQLTVDFDPKTGSTTPNYENKIDLHELIQTYKDQCGMEGAKRLIKLGQADASDFADDGQHSGDVTADVYKSVQSIANAAIAAGADVKKMQELMDLPDDASRLSEEALSAIIEKTIAKKYSHLIADSTVGEGGSGDAE